MAEYSLKARVLLGVTVVAASALAVASPVPADLPDVALGSATLLYLERVIATLALVGGAVLIAVRAIRGELPSRLGQIEYESLAAAENGKRIRELEQRTRVLERLAGLRGNAGLEGGNGDL